MKPVILAIALMFSTAAFAGQEPVRIVWDGPTEWESGDPLDRAVDISEYRVYCRRGSDSEWGAPYVFSDITPLEGDTSAHDTTRGEMVLDRGIYNCAIASVGAHNNLESELSETVQLRWTGPPGRARNLDFRRAPQQ